MAQYTAYANYVIYFRDETEYLAAIDIAGGNGYEKCPFQAAADFGIPNSPYPSGPLDDVKGIYTVSYSFSTPGQEIGHPLPSGITLDDTVDFVIVPGQAGVPASIWPAGPDLKLVWRGNIVRAGGAAGPNPGNPSAPISDIQKRRWSVGFELAGPETTPNLNDGCRDASRTIDGCGWAARRETSPYTISTTRFGGTQPTKSWERFYFRVRSLPAAETTLWTLRDNSGAVRGAELRITPTGVLNLYNLAGVSGAVLLGSTAGGVTVGDWYRNDILAKYRTLVPAENGSLKLFINGFLNLDFPNILAVDGGMGDTRQHFDSQLGSNAATTLEIDWDDWSCMDYPDITDGLDFLAGSHVRKHWVLSGSTTGWTGHAQTMNGGINPPAAVSSLTSSTALARLRGTSDVTDEQDTIGLKLGVVSALIGVYGSVATSADGQLGYSIALAAAVMAVVDQLNTPQWNTIAYQPTGMNPAPDPVEPMDVIYDKSNDGNATVVNAVTLECEYIGTFGLEDDPDSGLPRVPLIHNCNYSNTIWSFVGPAPDAPVFAVGLTYVGNATFQDIDLPAPCHFLWIRGLTGASQGVKWFGTSLGGHMSTTARVVPEYPVRVWTDSSGQTKLTVVGSNAEINANLVVYQVIAFCDPGMRFNLCGAFRQSPTPVSQIHNLVDDDFDPAAVIFQAEIVGTATNANGMYYKSTDIPGNAMSDFDGNTVANGAVLALGQFTALQGLADAGWAQVAYSAWRLDDGTGGVMFQKVTYTGNGVSPRVINLAPVSGRFPLLACVLPRATADGYMRDPSHAGANSARISTLSNVTNAIIAGAIDQITVDTLLNSNGQEYDVFVIPGDSAGWNNGIFYPPNTVAPGDTDVWPLPPTDPSDIGIIGAGGLVLSGDTAKLIVKDLSGLYTLVPGQKHDTILTRNVTATDETDVPIPEPHGETGYLGG